MTRYRRTRWDLVAYASRYGKGGVCPTELDTGTLQEFADALDRLVERENAKAPT